MIDLYNTAKWFLGVEEITGARHNPIVVAMLRSVEAWANRDEIPWCSAFVNFIAMLKDYERSENLAARSWLKVGKPVKEPKKGDVVVLWRGSRSGWQGHVGFLDHIDGSKIYMLGGNQNDAVNVRPYSKSRLLGYRRLSKVKSV